MGSCRKALFKLTEPGKSPSFFVLGEGEHNEWLEVKSVHSREGTAKIILKRPLARARNVGIEMVVSLWTGQAKRGGADLNRGNPHVDVPDRKD